MRYVFIAMRLTTALIDDVTWIMIRGIPATLLWAGVGWALWGSRFA